jgi:hypothetical protein
MPITIDEAPPSPARPPSTAPTSDLAVTLDGDYFTEE